MRKDTIGLALALALGGISARTRAPTSSKLANGSVMQGDLVAARTTADGLALGLYDTGGVVILRWDHIEPSRRSELRMKFGIDLPEPGAENVSGHRVLMTNGRVAVGVALNPRGDETAPDEDPQRAAHLRTRRARRSGPRRDDRRDAGVHRGGVLPAPRGRQPDARSRGASRARQALPELRAFEHARDELIAARDDVGCPPDDRSVAESLLSRTDVLIRGKGAADLAKLVQQARFADRWNDAKSLVARIAAEYSDPQVLEAIGFTALAARVEKGRDVYFEREVPAALHRALDVAIEAKARERRPSADADAPGATVRRHARRRAPVGEPRTRCDPAREGDERARPDRRRVRRVLAEPHGQEPPPCELRHGHVHRVGEDSGRSAGGRRPGGGAPAQTKADAPPTAEEWWESAAASERASWLKADFAQTGGLFDVIRTNDANCRDCGGTGVTSNAAPDGSSRSASVRAASARASCAR